MPGGFVPMQGNDLYDPPSIELPGPSGKLVTFRFADQVPDDFAVTDDVLAAEPAEAWSGSGFRPWSRRRQEAGSSSWPAMRAVTGAKIW
ncbi:hypothetical protein GCM10017772_03720 [Promicromonospora soli]|uniref:Uncharacterized protein n=1 Tax=Promicromonospora soli TaxID=2035533 RepID=A0A919FH62_9MICO|nr:hypothetical protein GCM10017772_03720 [Promicromonospora soli]